MFVTLGPMTVKTMFVVTAVTTKLVLTACMTKLFLTAVTKKLVVRAVMTKPGLIRCYDKAGCIGILLRILCPANAMQS